MRSDSATRAEVDLDVLVVGAGPTGLALATQLRAFGARFRLIDRLRDRTHESRALGVQARTLELLQTCGLGEPLVARGSTSTRLVLHLDAQVVARLTLGGIGAADTRFPFILFVSQAETEALLGEHLGAAGVKIERGIELTAFELADEHVVCVLRHDDGREERVRARFLAGCDGAHSAVRKGAGIPFEGGSYPQEFVLGDIEADGALEPGAINSFAGNGVAMFFPLGRPTTWRVIAMAACDTRPRRGEETDRESGAVGELSLTELQAIVDPPTGGCVRVRDPAWLTRFHLHHRQTAHYRAGRVFLAGDAAHVHSPVGAQGMNTGIQDAWNLGWKLALVSRGSASHRLLDSYEAERWPVGNFLLRYTDRIFATFTRVISGGKLAGWIRRVAMPRVLPCAIGSAWLRAAAFRFVSELGIRYRHSPAVVEGAPRLRGGPRPGDRLPDMGLTINGSAFWLQETIAGPRLALLLCGDPAQWDAGRLDTLRKRFSDTLAMHYLARHPAPGVLLDEDGAAMARLGVKDAAQYLIRPDGYVGFRCAGREFDALEAYLNGWYGKLGA
jgi:2-polyprenyl-6-methoxyphenol hydroxylase-like FAD-dependent oxidoreductase